jgi:hypothetical protein
MLTLTPEQKVAAGWLALDWLAENGHIEALHDETLARRIHEIDASGNVWLMIVPVEENEEPSHTELEMTGEPDRFNADELIARRKELTDIE